MYERLLDKTITPTFNDLIAYSGTSGVLWMELDQYLKDTFSAQCQIRFPYGNKYGWSSKYSILNKHICDAFAEQGAFSLHFHISNSSIDLAYPELSDYAREVCDHKYPCGGGGWLTYRIVSRPRLHDAQKLLHAKLNLKS